MLTISQATFRRRLRKFCADNGFKDITPHCLRHSFATMSYYDKDNDGLPMPIKHVMKFGGWKDYRTVERINTDWDSIELSKSIAPMSAFLDEE